MCHFDFQARTGDHDFAGLIDHPVKQLRPHPNHLVGRRAHRRDQHRRWLGNQAALDRYRFSCDARLRLVTLDTCHGHRLEQLGHQGLEVDPAQCFEFPFDRIKPGQKRCDILTMDIAGTDCFDFRLHSMRHFTQLQRTRQASTSLERMQRAQDLAARRGVVGACAPLAQRCAQLGQKLTSFLFENREQVRIEHIDQIDVVGIAGLTFERTLREEFGSGGHVSRSDERCNRLGPRCGGDSFRRRPNRLLEWRAFVKGWRFKDLHRRHVRRHGLGRRRQHHVFGGWDGQRQRGVWDGHRRHLVKQERPQGVQKGRVRLFQETRRKLVQQPTYVFRSVPQHTPLFGCSGCLTREVLQRMLQRPCHLRNGRETNRCRASCQGMGQRFGIGRHWSIDLQRPFGQLERQPTGPLVRLVQVHVVQRNVYAKRPDDLDLIRPGLVLGVFHPSCIRNLNSR